MEGWKGNLLNPAGKEVLIKTIIQAIPTYIMSIGKLPKTFCDKLTATAIRFWWSNNGNKRGIHRRGRRLCVVLSLQMGLALMTLIHELCLAYQAGLENYTGS